MHGRGGFGEEVDRLRCSNFRDLTRKIFQLVSWIGGRMTYSLERVHFISIYFSVCVYMIPETTFRSPYKSFRNSIRMKPSFWYKISFWYHVNRDRTSFRIDCVSDLAQKPREQERLWRSRSILSFYHSGTKLISEWKSFRYHMNTPSVKTNLLDKGL